MEDKEQKELKLVDKREALNEVHCNSDHFLLRAILLPVIMHFKVRPPMEDLVMKLRMHIESQLGFGTFIQFVFLH